MNCINVTVNPPLVYDVVINPAYISPVITENQVFQLIGQSEISGIFTITGSGNISITSDNNIITIADSGYNFPNINFFTTSLIDEDGSQSLDWDARILKDGLQNYSIQYNDRFLRDAAQDYVLDWNNKILSGNWTVQQLSISGRPIVTGSGITANIPYLKAPSGSGIISVSNGLIISFT